MEAETWKWIWLAAAAVFIIGEMATPGAFFLLPFGIGAGVATAAGFMEVALGIQWAIFVAVSGVTFMALRPIAKRMDSATTDHGIGVKRLVGGTAVVTQKISGGGGMIKFEAEEWRAVSTDGSVIPEGTSVRIVEIRGTRAAVARIDSAEGE